MKGKGDNFDSLAIKSNDPNKLELNLEIDNIEKFTNYRVNSNIELSYNHSASGHVSINVSIEKENIDKMTRKKSIDYELNMQEIDKSLNPSHKQLPFLEENLTDFNQETDRPIIGQVNGDGADDRNVNGEIIERCDNTNTEEDNKETGEKLGDIENEKNCKVQEPPEYKLRMCNLISLMLNISIGYFMIGYEVGVFNQIQENVNTDLGWDTEEKKIYISIISVMIPVGAVFGSVIMGKSAHNIGRKYAYITWDCIIIVGIAITMIANTYSMIIGRFICGFGVGGFVVLVPMLMKEYVPDRYEGYGAAMYAVSFNIGLLTSFALGLNISDITKPDFVWWRIMFAFPCILILINIILLLTKYTQETPIYLLSIDDREGCINSYKQIYEEEEDILKVILDLENHLKKKKEAEEITYSILCSPRFSKQLFIGFILNIAYMSPATNIFNSYSTMIFKRTEPLETATLFTTMLGVARFAGSIISIFIFGRIKKKTILLTGLTLMCCCLLIVSMLEYFQLPSPEKYIIIVLYFLYGLSIFTIMEIGPEILPDIGVGLITLAYWIFNIFIVVTLPYMISSEMELQWTIMLYFCILGLMIILIGIFYKESVGLTLNEVEELYKTWF